LSGASVSINNCFSATYLNYKIFLNNITQSTLDNLAMRLRVSGTDNSSSIYTQLGVGQYTVGGTFQDVDSKKNEANWILQSNANTLTDGQSFGFDVLSPFATNNTFYGPFQSFYDSLSYGGIHAGIHKLGSSFDGFTLFPVAGTFTGTYKIYGYANS
jgi:hypothetical protein